MLKIYKNEVHRILKEVHKLDTNRFVLTDGIEENYPFTKLSTIDSKMSFWFRNVTSSWEKFFIKNSKFTPNFDVSGWTPNPANSVAISFEESIKYFEFWINKDVKPYLEEIDAEDKWNEFHFETNIFQLTQVKISENESFTIEQSTQISNSIDTLKQLIIDKFTPNQEQLSHIEERLIYLGEATDRLGKFD